MISIERGSIIANRYRIERLLGRGGMGTVWVARHLQLDADVAIKFMAPEYAAMPAVRSRFESEAKAAARLRIPNVVQVYDYGVEHDTPYIAMELLHGEDLATRLHRQRRLTVLATAVLLDQVCKALRHAHEMGVIHRDLKPSNLFLASHADEEVVKVLDFGIAKFTGLGLVTEATKSGALVGSPHYMSPEQVRRRKDVDHRSDLWALGVIAFRCLTGRLPFPSDEIGDVLVEICTADIPRASAIAPDLAPEVDEFLERALMRDASQRFQSARELADAFGALPGSLRASQVGLALRLVQGLPILGDTSLSGEEETVSLSSASSSGAATALFDKRAADGVPAPRVPSGTTLAPSGRSLAFQPSRTARIGILLAIVGGTLAVGLVAFAILRWSVARADRSLQSHEVGPALSSPGASGVRPLTADSGLAAPRGASANPGTTAAPRAELSATVPSPVKARSSGKATKPKASQGISGKGRTKAYDPLREM